MSEVSIVKVESVGATAKGPRLTGKVALIACGFCAVGAGTFAWHSAHIPLEAQSAMVVADSVSVESPTAGKIEQILVKPGQKVQAGELLAIVNSPELVQKYSLAQKRLEDAKTQELTTQAEIVPPPIQGNMNPTGPESLQTLHSLPLAGPVASQPMPTTAEPAPPDSKKVTQLKIELRKAESLVSQCAQAVEADQADLDATHTEEHAETLPAEALKSTLDLAKAKRDKFQTLYDQGIISRAEFQQKQAEVDAAQKSVDEATEIAQGSQSRLTAKQEDLDSASGALAAAKTRAAKVALLLSQAQAADKKAVVKPPALPTNSKPPLIAKPPLSGFTARSFPMPAPPIAPLNIQFSPDKHFQAELKVEDATRDLKQASDELSACRIIAPSDGEIAQIAAVAGEDIAPKSAVLSIIKPASQRIVAVFVHSQALRLHYGQSCQVTFDSLPHRVFTGQISRFLDGGSKSSPAKIEILLPNQQNLLETIPPNTPTHITVPVN